MLSCKDKPWSSLIVQECFEEIRRKVLYCHNRLSHLIFEFKKDFFTLILAVPIISDCIFIHKSSGLLSLMKHAMTVFKL